MSSVATAELAETLRRDHYLGPSRRGIGWRDEFGCLVLAKPTSRRLPQDGSWLELVRWCLVGIPNGGSRQWAAVVRWLRAERREVTTIVSYSDPSVGHTGGLYRAANWAWAPTWHRLRPPPSGHGRWKAGKQQSVKDRWVYRLRPDARRQGILTVQDEALVRRGVVGYIEP